MRNTECQCAPCGRIFASTIWSTEVEAFDAHRTGDYDLPGQRRCLNDAEMALYFVYRAGTWRRRRIVSNEQRCTVAAGYGPALVTVSRSA